MLLLSFLNRICYFSYDIRTITQSKAQIASRSSTLLKILKEQKIIQNKNDVKIFTIVSSYLVISLVLDVSFYYAES